MSEDRVSRRPEGHDAVTRRMEQSRREIELLKTEYERLLEQGIRGSNTSNITDTDKQKEIQSKKEEKDTTNNTVRGCGNMASSSNIRLNNQDRIIKRPISDKVKRLDSSRQVSTRESPNKVKHYNVEDARDYIKKQREKRLLQQRQLKETDKAIELKKQKLKELHEKSLQIVARNRERSKSREKQKLADAEVPAPPSAMINRNAISSKSSVNSHKSNARQAKENVTYRVGSENKEIKIYVKSSAKSDDAKIKAATQIQAYYRGHVQRTIYKKTLENQSIVNKLAAEAIRAQKEAEIAKRIREEEQFHWEVAEKHRKEQEDAAMKEKQLQEEAKRKKLPEWLQPMQDIHPYNFITSVKRKLNVAMNSPAKTIDVAVQSSFCLDQQTPPESYKEVRDKIALSLSNKKPNEDDQRVEKTIKTIRDRQKEELFNGIGIQCEPAMELDAKRLSKMKLASDLSDSDTSKNIPDISFESHSHKTSSSKIDSSSKTISIPSEPVIVFKHPKEPPPKPKRLSRLDSMPFSSDQSLTKSQSDCSNISQKMAKSFDQEFQLKTGRLNDIKLQRRVDLIQENTMVDLESLIKKRSNSSRKRSLNDKHSNKDYNGDSRASSINTISFGSKIETEEASNSMRTENRKVSEDTIPSSSRSINRASDRNSNSIKSENSIRVSDGSKIVPYQFKDGSMGSRRDSTITGQISHYTRSFESYKDTQSKSIDESIENSGDLKSFRQYMKGMNESKIMHTPFQPKRHQRGDNQVNPEQRLQEVIVKVNELDEKLSKSEGSKVANAEVELEPVIATATTMNQDSFKVTADSVNSRTENHIKLLDCEELDNPLISVKVKPPTKALEPIENGENDVEKLVPPNVNLIVLKCSDENKENKLSAKTSTETVANGPSNQIHVKFEAELHLLNDFNESLRQIMNIEKSMLDLQTKYNLPTSRETRDTQTSIMSPPARPSNNSSSTIEKSINFSRGSDPIANHPFPHKSTTFLTDNSINISDITIGSLNNTTQQSTQNALTLNTLNASRDIDTIDKLNSAGISLGMFNQLIRDEDARIENLKTVLKIREKALLDRTKSELTWLEIQKKQLLETGKLHEASLLKKKQRGIILKLQEETNEMQRLREAQKAASKERKTKLKEQRALIKAQLSGPHVITRIKRSSERRTSGPVKVYQSEYYQSETSISRKSSISESVVYTSRSASILSKHSDSDHKDDAARLEPNASRTEMAKRSLQMREAALQKRRKEAEDLLKWHQKLLKEERKIADLEMAATNVINQVPAADGDKYAYKSSAPAIWVDMTAINKQKSESSMGKSKTISESATNNLKGYSMDFDSDKEDVILEKGIKQSESTLNEIMHNINNITDEISELYKISSIKKSASSQHDSIIQTDNSLSEVSDSRSSKASIINKQTKLVPEDSVVFEKITSEDSNDFIIGIDTNQIIGDKNHSSSVKKSDRPLKTSIKTNAHLHIPPENEKQILLRGKSREETEEDVSSIQSEVNDRETTTKESLDGHSEMKFEHAEESLFGSIKLNLKLTSSVASIDGNIISENHRSKESMDDRVIENVNVNSTPEIECIAEKSDIISISCNKSDSPNDNISSSGVKTNIVSLENVKTSNNKSISDLLPENVESVDNHTHFYLNETNASTDESLFKPTAVEDKIISNVLNSPEHLNSSLISIEESESELSPGKVESQSLKSISLPEVSTTIKEVESLPYTTDNNDDTIDGNIPHSEEPSINSDTVSTKKDISYDIEEEIPSSETNNKTGTLQYSIVNSRELQSGIESVQEYVEKPSNNISEELSISVQNLGPNESDSLPLLEDKHVSIETKSDGQDEHVISNDLSYSDADSFKSSKSDASSNLSVKIVDLIPENTEKESIQEQTFTVNEDSILSEHVPNIAIHSEELVISEYNDNTKLEECVPLEDTADSIRIQANVTYEIQSSPDREDSSSIQDADALSYNDVSEVTLVAEDIEENSESETSTLKSHSVEEAEDSLPIIGIKIEEKRPIEEWEDDINENAEDSESVKESVQETSITDEDDDSKKSIDVKKRVSEILADANLNTSIEEKSPRLPDIYVTTYDVITPDNSPELGSPVDNTKAKPKDIYGIGNEAQELLRKQLAIEQEIKQIERQQKQQLPYIFVREIPNKPPPPYTPPVQHITSIVPSAPAQIEDVVPHLAEIFYRGFVDNTLEYVTFPDLKIDKLDNIDKLCTEFLFDISKEITVKHYKQFVQIEEATTPWMTLKKRQHFKRPHTQMSLESMLKKKLNQLFGFEKIEVKESMIIKWSRKRRDNVDELLVAESQAEEAEWTNYDQDELIVKDEVTNSLLDILIGETVMCFQDIFKKRQSSHC